MAGDTFNQNHSGSGNNVINFGRQEFHLTDDIMNQILQNVGGRSVSLMSVADWDMGDRLAAFLRSSGVNIASHNKAAVYGSVPPHKKPVQISLSDDHAAIILDPS